MLLADKKILMFEDNFENITVQTAFLEKEGATVHLFLGGQLEDLIKFLPLDVIIMDLMLPGGISGFDFFQMIQANSKLASIPVVAVSAMEASQAVSKTKALGFAGFIAKPVDMDLFSHQIASIIAGEHVWDINRR